MDKKGISEVVSSILIVIITVAAVAYLASIIVPYVQNKLNKGSECFNYNAGYFQFEQEINGKSYNCYTSSLDKFGFSIKATETLGYGSGADKVLGFNIILSGTDGSGKVISASLGINSSASLPSTVKQLDGSTGVFIPKPGETASYSYTPQGNPKPPYTKADVYPVLKSGKICGLSDSITLRVCSSGVTLT